MILKTAGATKEDLPLDGSLEFYAMVMIAAVAAVAIWELLKRAGNIVAKWCAAARRKRERLERLRARAQTAVQEEMRRYEPTSDAATSWRTSTSSMSRRSSVRTTCTQTEPGPAVTPVDRLEACRGPFYVTPHGDRVHLKSYCHGQRNASSAPRRLELCNYCDRTQGLYILTPPTG